MVVVTYAEERSHHSKVSRKRVGTIHVGNKFRRGLLEYVMSVPPDLQL